MNLFENKLNRIDEILKGERSNAYSDYQDSKSIYLSESKDEIKKSEDDKVVAKIDHSSLKDAFGVHRFSFMEPKIGPHPDFSHLGHSQYLNHYAVSAFFDIKGSTRLSNQYNLLQIRQIKDTILTLIIEVCSFFGGHVQRLQGDGVFVYFVRSEMNPKDAIINALNAASLINYFMKYKLPDYFNDEEIKPPRIRSGIDFGDETQTIWSYYGLEYCNELTTTGLHTDLAAKLQAKSPSNGVMIGQNIVEELDLQNKVIGFDNEDPYIFNNSYRKYEFKWENYLLSFDFINKDSNGNLEINRPSFYLECEVANEESENYHPYHQNLYSIPKKCKIRFTLYKDGGVYNLKTIYGEEIVWKIVNTGKEATAKDKLNQNMDDFKNHTSCSVTAEFLGHHEMQCKIIKKGSLTNVNVRYPVFVR